MNTTDTPHSTIWSTVDCPQTGTMQPYNISIAERNVFIVVSLEIFRIPVQDNAKITFAVFNASPTVCDTKIVIFSEMREEQGYRLIVCPNTITGCSLLPFLVSQAY